ncbi:hypothetical protein KKC45_00755 [Patescibacteria group bacterium]|nr:hypothetical protein [Patescibacteria group bacterium]
MTEREVIRVLLGSPIYFRLTPENRRELIQEFLNHLKEVKENPSKKF